MQITQINNQNFTGVIPVKVIANGAEAIDEDTIRKSCNALIRALSGPVKDNPNTSIKMAAAKLGTMDADYDYFRAYTRGYLANEQDIINSDFFKTIIGKHGGYIVTGEPVRLINEAGHEIGKARKECRLAGVATNQRLFEAQEKYYRIISRVGADISQRIKEIFDPKTRHMIGKQQQIELNVTTKNVKRNGKSSVIVKSIDNISFSDRPKFTKSS